MAPPARRSSAIARRGASPPTSPRRGAASCAPSSRSGAHAEAREAADWVADHLGDDVDALLLVAEVYADGEATRRWRSRSWRGPGASPRCAPTCCRPSGTSRSRWATTCWRSSRTGTRSHSTKTSPRAVCSWRRSSRPAACSTTPSANWSRRWRASRRTAMRSSRSPRCVAKRGTRRGRSPRSPPSWRRTPITSMRSPRSPSRSS